MGFQPASFSAYAMPADYDALLQLATRPLEGNPELLLAARGDLESRLRQSSVSDSEVASAIEAFQRADRRGFLFKHWRKAVYLVALALGLLGALQVQRLRDMAKQISSIGSIGAAGTALPPRSPSHLTNQQLLILCGDESASNLSDRWKALRDTDPQNPVFFAQYVHGVFADIDSLPPDLLEEAARIDPGNGWYHAIQAGALLDGTVVREKQKPADQKALKAPTYTVKAPEKLAAALVLIQQAAAADRIDSRQKELIGMQIPLLGERTDWFSQIRVTAHVAAISSIGAVSIRRIPDALAVEAQRLAEEGKRDEFLRLIESWDAINRHVLDGGWTLVDMLIAKVMIVSPAATFRDAALKLGLEKEAERFERIVRWVSDERERRNSKRNSDPNGLLVERRGAILATLTLPMVAKQAQTPPPLTEGDLLPSRLAEHALFQRILVTPSCLILALAAGLASIRFLVTNSLNRKLSARLTDLLHCRDWILVLLAGSILPIVFYFALVYLSPLSGREWSFRLLGFTPFFAHMAAALVLVMTTTTVLASHVLDRSMKAFGLISGPTKTRWAMLLCAALAPVIIGAVPLAFYEFNLPPPASQMLLWSGCSLSAIPLLWLIGGLVKPLFGFGGSTLRFSTLHRVLVPAWIFGFIILAITSPLHHAIERHWMQKDRLMEITPDSPSLSRYEWEVTQQLRRELLEKL